MKVDGSKVVIWTCLLLSAVGVASHFYFEKRLEEAGKDVETALKTLKRISVAREDIAVLNAELQADEFRQSKAENRMNTFFAQVASQAKMDFGPSVQKPKDDTPPRAQGYEDTSYELYWEKSRTGPTVFTREQCTAFMWWIQKRSNLLKITDISLKTSPTKQGEYQDLWELRLWVTDRHPITTTGAGASAAEES